MNPATHAKLISTLETVLLSYRQGVSAMDPAVLNQHLAMVERAKRESSIESLIETPAASKKGHTPAPWIAAAFGIITDQNENAIGHFMHNHLLQNDRKADAEHAVECVNLCEDLGADPRGALRTVREGLEGILTRYVGLANSGDAGHWDPEQESEVAAARAALQLLPKK
jgi:hypothetical protein